MAQTWAEERASEIAGVPGETLTACVKQVQRPLSDEFQDLGNVLYPCLTQRTERPWPLYRA